MKVSHPFIDFDGWLCQLHFLAHLGCLVNVNKEMFMDSHILSATFVLDPEPFLLEVKCIELSILLNQLEFMTLLHNKNKILECL